MSDEFAERAAKQERETLDALEIGLREHERALEKAHDRIRELEHGVETLTNALAGERDEVKRLNDKYAPLVTRRPIPSDEWDE